MPSHGDASSRYDVVVIGAGPAGEAAAELGGTLGYSVALVERDTVGGTVVTSGGAPTKTFREAAVYLSSFEKEKVYGVDLSAPPDVMYPAVRARAREVSEQLRQATLERIRERGVQLVRGEARLEADHTVVARTGDGTETRLRAGRVIIATGSTPLRPAGVPFDDPCVAAAIYGLPEVARAGKSEEDCAAEGIPYEIGRCELGTTPRGLIAGQEGLLKLVFHSGSGVLLGVHAICEIASEIAGTGQAMIHNEATIEDVLRMAYNTPTYTYGYKLAAGDALARLHPDVLRPMRLPSQAHRI